MLDAIEDYLADGDLAAGTVTAYRRTLDALVDDLGGDIPIGKISRARARPIPEEPVRDPCASDVQPEPGGGRVVLHLV